MIILLHLIKYIKQMGEQTSKARKYLVITVQDFMKFKNPFDFEEKPLRDYDYSKYTKKKFYKEDATDQEVEEHLKMLQQKEKLLQDFPFHDEFDRLSPRGLGGSSTELNFFLGIVPLCIGLIFTVRFFTNHSSFDLFSRVNLWNNFFRLFPGALFLYVGTFMFRESFNITQNSYFMSMRPDMSFYAICDEELDVFQDVEETKYQRKAPSYREFHSYRRAYHENSDRIHVGLAESYYRRFLGDQTDIYDDYLEERTTERKAAVENKMNKMNNSKSKGKLAQ